MKCEASESCENKEKCYHAKLHVENTTCKECETMKPDCYECEYRGTVPGSCHSSCHHPAFEQLVKDSTAQILGIFAQVGRVAPIQGKAEGITVKGNKHGIQNGWFNHPFNFDPIWLEECNGFKQKVKEEL